MAMKDSTRRLGRQKNKESEITTPMASLDPNKRQAGSLSYIAPVCRCGGCADTFQHFFLRRTPKNAVALFFRSPFSHWAIPNRDD